VPVFIDVSSASSWDTSDIYSGMMTATSRANFWYSTILSARSRRSCTCLSVRPSPLTSVGPKLIRGDAGGTKASKQVGEFVKLDYKLAKTMTI